MINIQNSRVNRIKPFEQENIMLRYTDEAVQKYIKELAEKIRKFKKYYQLVQRKLNS